jgi:hypothetical protein
VGNLSQTARFSLPSGPQKSLVPKCSGKPPTGVPVFPRSDCLQHARHVRAIVVEGAPESIVHPPFYRLCNLRPRSTFQPMPAAEGPHSITFSEREFCASQQIFTPIGSYGSFSSDGPAPDALGMSASLRSRPNLRTAANRRDVPIGDVCSAANRNGRGRDASYLAPPAQNRTCGFPAYGSHLGCVTAKRSLGQGCRMIGSGSQSFASCVIRTQVIRSFWLRRRSVRRHCGASALVWHLLQFLRRVLSCGTPARRGIRLSACSSTPHVHRSKC